MTRPTDAELVKLLRHLAFDVEGDGQPLPIDVRCHVADARATADALAQEPEGPRAEALDQLAELLREPCDSNDRMTARATVRRLTLGAANREPTLEQIEIAKDIEAACEAFNSRQFIRNTDGDGSPGWVVKLLKPLGALGRLQDYALRATTKRVSGEGQP